MVHRPATWFRNVAILGALVALALVPAVNALLHGELSLWLHVPLTIVVLTLMAGGSIVTGVAFVEYQARASQPK